MWVAYTGTTSSGDKLSGKRMGVIGSSSADADFLNYLSWYEDIANQTGLVPVDYADAGSYLTSTTTDYSSVATNQLKRIDELPTNLDFVIAQPGTNDDINSRPIGTFSSRAVTDVYGALHTMCQKLLTKFPTQPLGVLTPQYFANNTDQTNAVNTAIKEVCGYYGIPVCDLHAEGRTPYSFSTFKSAYVQSDGLHLNEQGNLILSRRIEAFLRMLWGG